MVHIAESTVGRRYAGWFIKNTERAQKIFDDLKHTPLPGLPAYMTNVSASSSGANLGVAASAIAASAAAPIGGAPRETADAQAQAQGQAQKTAAPRKVAWGGVRA
jgi:translation initiation factor 3 subunit L